MDRGIRGIDPSSALYTRLVTDLDEHRRVGRREEQRDRARDQQSPDTPNDDGRSDESGPGEAPSGDLHPADRAGVYHRDGSPAQPPRADDDDGGHPVDVVA